MKALVYTGPKQIEYRDAPEPVSNEDVIVRVEACGICGSDMHAYQGHDERRPPPLILGHEAAGTVLTGDDAGRRVAINPLVTCGHCNACLGGRPNLCAQRQIISMAPRAGAFAEQIAVPATNIVELPPDMPVELAALTEPMAVSYHAVNLAERGLAMPLSAASSAVIGGGAIGLGAAQIIRSRGCQSITVCESSALRRTAIADMPGLEVYDPAATAGPPDSGIDVVVDAYGGEASRREASRLVRPGGVVVHIGLASGEGGLDIRKMTLQEVTFIGTYTYTMVEFRETLAGLASGLFGTITWTEERPLSDGAAAFRALDDGAVAAAKIVLRM